MLFSLSPPFPPHLFQKLSIPSISKFLFPNIRYPLNYTSQFLQSEIKFEIQHRDTIFTFDRGERRFVIPRLDKNRNFGKFASRDFSNWIAFNFNRFSLFFFANELGKLRIKSGTKCSTVIKIIGEFRDSVDIVVQVWPQFAGHGGSIRGPDRTRAKLSLSICRPRDPYDYSARTLSFKSSILPRSLSLGEKPYENRKSYINLETQQAQQ